MTKLALDRPPTPFAPMRRELTEYADVPSGTALRAVTRGHCERGTVVGGTRR